MKRGNKKLNKISNDHNKLQEQTEAEFKKLEDTLTSKYPGVMDLLQVYGGYEAAQRQADAYFSLKNFLPIFSTSNRSNS